MLYQVESIIDGGDYGIWCGDSPDDAIARMVQAGDPHAIPAAGVWAAREVTPDDLVTLAEVAARAGVSRLTPRQWVRRDLGAPEPWKPGRFGDPHLYLWSEWEQWLRETGRSA